MVKAIDIMCYIYTPEGVKKMFYEPEELYQVVKWWKLENKVKGYSSKEFIALLNEAGVEYVCIPAVKMKSYKKDKLIWDISIEEVKDAIDKIPGRGIGIAGVNPLKRLEGVKEVERAVKEFGFRGVYIHTYGFGIPLNDKLYYPFYAKCCELNIPVFMQVGHSAELMPSRFGQPILLDDIALDFPDLTIVGAHTGWPWIEEMIAVAWKHPNVYIGIDAHLPKYLDPSLINFLKTRGRGKVMWGTNYPTIYQKESLDQVKEWGLKEEVEKLLIRDVATKVLKL